MNSIEIRRQYKGDDRRASEYFAEGKFHDALGIYQAKGAVHWTRTQGEARAELLDSYRRDVAASPEKSRFIFAYTNLDVAELNQGAREIHRQLGKLGQDHELECADGRRGFAAGDRIQFTKTDKKAGLYNGAAGTIKHIENGRVFTEMDDSGKIVAFDSAQYQSFRHGYAGTIYKGQGATVDQSYLYHSEHWRSAASYVGMTRHREKAELFAAKNTAADLDQLARQMARVDAGKRYAASYYHARQHIGPVRPLTAAEILASFGDKKFEREQQQDKQARRRGPDMGYSHGDYASQSRAALRERTQWQRRAEQQDDKRAANQNALSLDDIAQRVQRIIDDPTREADESDPRILQALHDRREAAQTAQPAAEEETRRLAEESSTSEERQPESSGEKEAKEIESAASSQEMTDGKQVQYSRWTGQLIGAAGRQTTQRTPGGGQGRTRTR